MKSSFCFVFLLFFIANVLSLKHECIHDQLNKFKPAVLASEKQENTFLNLNKKSKEKRINEYTTTRPIKILIDDSNMQDIEADKRDFILKNLIPISTDFLERRLTVLTRGAPLFFKEETCIQATIPEIHKTQGFDADLVIYVTAKPEPDSAFLAWAKACFLDPVTGRPVGGQVNFNSHFIDLSPSAFEQQVDIVLHEITHVLVFDPILFEGFRKDFYSAEYFSPSEITENVTIQGRSKTIIKTPKVLEVAREYFNCSQIRGVEVEDQRGEGSGGTHWERSILYNEIMTASAFKDLAYSDFTLALLQDSGWYIVDFSKSEPMFFGKGAGCSFVAKKCEAENIFQGNEFRKAEEKSLCTYDFKSKAHCEIEAFSDECRFASGFMEGDCENENNQVQCAWRNIWPGKTSCFPHRCTNDRRKAIFTLSDGSDIVCEFKGQEVAPPSTSNYKGKIKCPDPQVICQDFYPGCPKSCSNKGYCVKGVCECSPGFTGNDCSTLDNRSSSPYTDSDESYDYSTENEGSEQSSENDYSSEDDYSQEDEYGYSE